MGIGVGCNQLYLVWWSEQDFGKLQNVMNALLAPSIEFVRLLIALVELNENYRAISGTR